MPTREAYLIRYEDGTCRTVQAHSVKGAAALFAGQYRVPEGARFQVKRRGEGGGFWGCTSEAWTSFSRTAGGVRKLSS